MTTRTWNGTTGNFSTASDWSPTGVPVSGDVAVINSGTVTVNGTIDGVTIQLNEASGAASSTTLALVNAVLDSAGTLTVTNSQNSVSSPAAVISVSGVSTLQGTDTFNGTTIGLSIAAGSTLVNSGTLNFYAASPQSSGGGTLQNNGAINLINSSNATQVPVLDDPLTGTGTISLGPNAHLELGSSVAAGQTVTFTNGGFGNEILQLDSPASFTGTINGFSSGDLIAVTNTPYTNATYTSTSSNSGVLALFNNGTPEGSLNFSGQYTLASFGFSFTNFGNTNLQITTTGTNYQTGTLPAGTLPNAVYRFFDTHFGTHLFTQSLAEAQNILAARPDLTEETNGFGSVNAGSPSSEAVYRFFEPDGTHFFTANLAEAQAIQTPGNPDYQAGFIAEPSSTFYENSVNVTGDVAVYRFFDQSTGTQFLSGDANEIAAVQTPGNADYHPNFVNEGIDFYAPAGSFHT